MNDNDWDDLKFIRNVRHKASADYISISKKGNIGFSAEFMQKNALKVDDATHVNIAYSKKNHALLFNFIRLSEKRPGERPFKLSGQAGHFHKVCSPKRFFLGEGVEIVKISGRYEAKFVHIPPHGYFFAIELNY